MKLTWHLIKKDLRRFWPMSLFLAIVVVLETLCGARLLGHEGELDIALFSRVNGYATFLGNVQMLMIALFTATLIQEDSLVGTSRYWMTRPISNRRLLAAKCGALVLLAVVVPALAAVPWWVYAGWSSGECLRGLLSMMGPNSVVALLASPVALVTPNLARFLLASFLGLLVFAGIMMVTAAWGWQRNLSPHVTESRVLVTGWCIVAVTLAVIAIQLRPRRTVHAANVLSVGYLMIAVAAAAWPWALSRSSAVRELEDPATQGITLTADGIHLYPRRPYGRPLYRLHFDMSGVPRDTFVSGETLVGQRIIWSDGESEVRVTGPTLASPVVPQAGVLLGLEDDSSEPRYTVRLSKNLAMQPAIADRFNEKPGAFEMRGRFHLLSPYLRGEVPFEAGAVIAGDSRYTRIVRIEENDKDRTVTVIECRPSPIRSRRFIGSILTNNEGYLADPVALRAHHHYLVNRSLGHLIEAEPFPGRGKPIRHCSIAFVEIHWRELVFSKDHGTNQPDRGMETNEELSFASLTSREVATFERTLVFPATMFPLPTPAEPREQ